MKITKNNLFFFFIFLFSTVSSVLGVSTRDFEEGTKTGISLTQWGYADPVENLSDRIMLYSFLSPQVRPTPYLGVKFSADAGENVYSICDGKVIDTYAYTYENRYETFYNKIVIQCEEPRLFTVLYGFVKNFTVREGDHVRKGQKIAEVAPYYSLYNNRRDPGEDGIFIGINTHHADIYSWWKRYLYYFASSYSSEKVYHIYGSSDASKEDIEKAGFVDPFEFLSSNPINTDNNSNGNPADDNQNNSNGNNNGQSEEDNQGNQQDEEGNQENPQDDEGSQEEQQSDNCDSHFDKDKNDNCKNNNKEQQDNINYSIFDGAASIVDPTNDSFGGAYDLAKMQPHRDKTSTVVFQWFTGKDYDNCKYLKIFTPDYTNSIDVKIYIKNWKDVKPFKVLKTKLDSNGIYLEKPKNSIKWLNIAVQSEKPISSSDGITVRAECTSSKGRSNRYEEITPGYVKVDDGNIWSGTSSLISFIPTYKERFGVNKDYIITTPSSKGKTLATVQWFAGENCKTVKISYRGKKSSFSLDKIRYKQWDKNSWIEAECNSLPCEIDAPYTQYFILEIFGKAKVYKGKDGIIQVKCVNY